MIEISAQVNLLIVPIAFAVAGSIGIVGSLVELIKIKKLD
ncbi:hypothetical protein M670_03698 [Schinkia azotoformans MEV2011]|uniref:Uncharacterized protein n=1 Tax=Schinkia azotoformans MEV2011 TaxID=1348973 RepID=A0A072NV62_SCHAZ|nr:hypothetical protein M670_03698 [Schinkia azotoformans MEV2011]